MIYYNNSYNITKDISKSDLDNDLENFIKLLCKVNCLSMKIIKPYMTFLNIKESDNNYESKKN